MFPKHRSDLVEAAVVVQRMQDGPHRVDPGSFAAPLDVLAQQIVAMCAVDDWSVDELAALVRRAAPFTDLSDDVLHAALDLLAGRYPSEEFAEGSDPASCGTGWRAPCGDEPGRNDWP